MAAAYLELGVAPMALGRNSGWAWRPRAWPGLGLGVAAARVPDRRSPSRIAYGARFAAAFGRH
jgi:hypothetical protein